MKAGEVCAGYGGLMMAIEEVFAAEPAWVSEFDEAPSKILAYRYPRVPNYGDMTKIDWASIEPVDIIGGGTPCQDLSHAGKRKGMTEGTRSNLWVHMREAIAIQQPLFVAWENVRGAYSADADSDLEFCPGCMGEAGDRESVLRALGRVLGDLSDLGYDCQWRGLRASDVGAPHARFRVFVLARRRSFRNTDGPNVEGQRAGGLEVARLAAGARERGSAGLDLADAHDLGYERGWEARGRRLGLEDRSQSSADSEGFGRGEGRPESEGIIRRLATTGNQSSSADADGGHDDGRVGDAQRGQEQREAAAGRGEGFGYIANAEGDAGRKLDGNYVSAVNASDYHGDGRPDVGAASGRERVNWGDYEPAITRWERAIGRPAPRPTEPSDAWVKMIAKRKAGLDKRPVGMRGSIAPAHRLSPRFTEWMMGLPDGWVTDPAIGISRNDQLKACGNGVVPQQAIAAFRDMLNAFWSEGIAA